MRSGRVLTRGRFTVSEELNALAELKMLLCEEAEELEFNEPGVSPDGTKSRPASCYPHMP